MYVGSLFSGIGGLDLGFERQGYKPRWFIEKNLFAQSILHKHWTDIPIYSDVTKLDFSTVSKVDILTGGFPCQDISIVNSKAQGITGSKSSLWKYYLKAIRQIRPRVAVIENVPMLARRGLDVVLKDLAQTGYDAQWICIRASEFGAWHQRERLFVVAYPSGIRVQSVFACRFAHKKTKDGQSDPKTLSYWPSIQFDIPTIQSMLTSAICRKDDGIPNRVDRIRCLGNAVVPQVAQYVAQCIQKTNLLSQ